ncbi:hypothetical protein QUF54_03985, partial [Candidatus Marithioploca araucensis]|nr:hypothetical protein [Candidatus Marithioploca araucensis]
VFSNCRVGNVFLLPTFFHGKETKFFQKTWFLSNCSNCRVGNVFLLPTFFHGKETPFFEKTGFLSNCSGFGGQPKNLAHPTSTEKIVFEKHSSFEV